MADKIDLPPLYRTVPSAKVAERRKKPDEKSKNKDHEPPRREPERGKGDSKVDEYV